MSHVAHVTGDVVGRGLQASGLLVGAIQGTLGNRRAQARADGSAVERLVAELGRTRRENARLAAVNADLAVRLARAEQACAGYARAFGFV